MRKLFNSAFALLFFFSIVIIFQSCDPPKNGQQAVVASTPHVRAFAAASMNSISGDSYQGAGMLPGWMIGGEFNFPINPQFAFAAGLGYAQKGGKYKESYGGGKVVTSYVIVPLVVRFQPKGNHGFYAEAGLEPAILLSAKDKYDGGSDDVKSELKGFDLGIPIGIGYDFKNRLGVKLRVIPGIMDLDKEKSYDDESNRNFTAALGVTYSFPLGKKK